MVVRGVPQRREVHVGELEGGRELAQQLVHAVQEQQEHGRRHRQGRVLGLAGPRQTQPAGRNTAIRHTLVLG